MNIKLAEVINTQEHLFPLSLSLFKELLTVEQYQLKASSKDDTGIVTQITDFKALFYTITERMAKAGVSFFSPGGSYHRRFIYWYNAHYWAKMKFEYDVDVRSSHVRLLHSMVSEFFHSDELKINDVAFDDVDTVIIEQGNKLTPLGKDFLLSLPLFKPIISKVQFFD